MELASRGDRQKVNLTIGDLKNDSEEEDWYHIMPDLHLAFTFGKASEERFDGMLVIFVPDMSSEINLFWILRAIRYNSF